MRWHLLISQTGKYWVHIRYAAPATSKGNQYLVTIAGQTLKGSVVGTGEGYHYRTFEMGTLRIRKSGPQIVEIEPATDYGHNLMFLQSLELAPVGPP